MRMAHRRVVHVIDDEANVCEALKLLLHTAGLEARTYASAEEFLSEVRLSKPVCLLVDVRLPGMSGLDLVRQLQQGPVRPVVVMITGHGDVPLAVKAMRAGALHFIEKPFEPTELLQALEEALQRVSQMAADEVTSAVIEASYQSLTPREQEVMALLAEGMPTKLLATKLGISTRTAEHHRAAVLKKMGARTVSHLARMSMNLEARNLPIRS
jgi:FixJ family two-component response regulator